VANEPDIIEQIRQAVEKTPVLLFMKGTSSFPQCGFSARVVQVLESYGVPYKTVDVLSNPAVREGVKRFANWPTIPQLYVGGKFVGGCDIVTEMHESGELEPLLREAAGAAAQA
jgi:monothiol glutaredoxin